MNRYNKIMLAVGIFAVSGAASAGDLTEVQMKTFCKLVDPTFLNRLPIIMEMKAAGIGKVMASVKYGWVAEVDAVATSNIVAIYDANATTVDEAIIAIETSCVNTLKKHN
jgi:hypothetical protein